MHMHETRPIMMERVCLDFIIIGLLCSLCAFFSVSIRVLDNSIGDVTLCECNKDGGGNGVNGHRLVHGTTSKAIFL